MAEFNIDNTQIGWEVNLLYYFAHAATILAADIDQQLMKMFGDQTGFIQQKKKWLNNYNDCIAAAREKLRQADVWMEKIDPDTATFDSVGRSSKRYTNVLAFANEFIRFNMLYMDRSQTAEAAGRVFKMLRYMPEGGIFPEKFLDRFRINFELVPEKGDRIRNANYGDGTLEFSTGNGNWQCSFDSGKKVILNESLFTLL